MSHMRRIGTFAAILPLALAGCSDEADSSDSAEAVERGGKLSGDVSGGSISDAMIPLESLRSQSPPAEPVVIPPGEEGDGASENAEADGAEPEADEGPDEGADTAEPAPTPPSEQG